VYKGFIDKLQEHLTKPLPGKDAQFLMAPTFRIDIPNNENPELAAVLILLYPIQNKWHTVFMKRTEYPGAHSGQISFPGGKYETSDTYLKTTALRETEEEFGINSAEIKVIGSLTPLHIPVSKIDVHPFIGYLGYKPKFKPDSNEVAYLIEANLLELLNPSIIEAKPFKSGKYDGMVPYYNIKGNHVWGATAMILSEFLEIVKKL
jgi:8-oxo-dGTP pyrophosphatase MutT (NUDIX family)